MPGKAKEIGSHSAFAGKRQFVRVQIIKPAAARLAVALKNKKVHDRLPWVLGR